MSARLGDLRLLQISIALHALRRKPAHESIADYVARLKIAFGVTPPAYEDRERAGRLQDALAKAEVERETMNARLQELKLECEALRAAAAAAAKDTPTPATDVVESSKKKRRRKAAPLAAHVPDHAGLLAAASDNATSTSVRPSIFNVFSSLEHLNALTAEASSVSPELIAGTPERSIRAIGSLLSTSASMSNNSSRALDALSTLLPFSLEVLLPLHDETAAPVRKRPRPAPSRPTFASMLAPLAEHVLLPLVRAIALLSARRVEAAFGTAAPGPSSSSTKDRRLPFDARWGLVEAAEHTLGLLQSFSADNSGAVASIRALKAQLALAVLGELELLYPPRTPASEPPPPFTRAERLAQLARPDTLELLCRVLRVALEPGLGWDGGTDVSALDRALHARVLAQLSAFGRRVALPPAPAPPGRSWVVHGMDVMDDLERSIFLGVVEGAFFL